MPNLRILSGTNSILEKKKQENEKKSPGKNLFSAAKIIL